MKSVPHYVKSLAMTIPAVLVGLQISAWIGFVLSPDRQQRADFRAYYYAGEMVQAGHSHHLYDGYDPANPTSAFIHPAYEAILFLPLSFLSMRTAHSLWVFLSLMLIYVLDRALRRSLANMHGLFPWLCVAVIFSFLPVSETMMQGQDSLLLAVLVGVAFERLRRKEMFAAGLLLGLGTFRFQFLAVIILLFLLWKGWRLVEGFCASGAIMLLLSSTVVGWEGQRQYLRLLKRIADPSQQPVIHMVNLRATLTALHSDSAVLVSILSVIILLAVAWLGRKAQWNSRLLLATAAACLLSYHVFLHDLSLLIVPLLVTCDRALAGGKYINLGILALVVAFPTLLAMAGLPLWMNSLASVVMLLQIKIVENSSIQDERGILVGARSAASS